MTLDDQLRALAPLDAGVVARLAGYSDPVQLRKARLRGSRLPDAKLRAVAQRLRDLADTADGLTAAAPTTGPARRP